MTSLSSYTTSRRGNNPAILVSTAQLLFEGALVSASSLGLVSFFGSIISHFRSYHNTTTSCSQHHLSSTTALSITLRTTRIAASHSFNHYRRAWLTTSQNRRPAHLIEPIHRQGLHYSDTGQAKGLLQDADTCWV
jgi:hypothetical protein